MAAPAFDVAGLLSAVQQVVEAAAGKLLPSALSSLLSGSSSSSGRGAGGGAGAGVSLRHVFRPDGFFAYADDRQAQVGVRAWHVVRSWLAVAVVRAAGDREQLHTTHRRPAADRVARARTHPHTPARNTQAATVLLARLLSWLHLGQVVAPGSPSCLRFVLVLGEPQSGKATLFARLVDAPAEYAAQLGGASGGAAVDGTQGMAAAGGARAAGASGAAAPAAKPGAAPAVDLRLLSGSPSTYAVCFPGLFSGDAATQQIAQGLAAAMGREWAARRSCGGVWC
jgi:hypothetical protein